MKYAEVDPSFSKPRSTAGRPPITELQPALLETIINIAMHGSAADERRRSEALRSCLTLDDLHNNLISLGFQISRTGTYLHLMPRSYKTTEGKRHFRTVPVKLSKPQSDLHKSHIDGEFCTSTIRNLEPLASLLGPDQVFTLSQNDKARVPLGLPAVKKQCPILMHMEYRVLLPDHDWVVAERHKLIPSVYAGFCIKKDGFGKEKSIGYSGPTYIAIRSGKHSSSTANSHASDFERLFDIPAF